MAYTAPAIVGYFRKNEASRSDIVRKPLTERRFEALYQEHADRVYTLAVHFSADPCVAQDITQSVFLKIYRGLASFRHDAEIATWIHRITYNACLDHARRQRVRAFLSWANLEEVDAPGPESESPLAHVERKETSRLVQGALSELPARYRMPILLRYLEELSYQEISLTSLRTRGAPRAFRGSPSPCRSLPRPSSWWSLNSLASTW